MVVIMTTVTTQEEADRLSAGLLEGRLAACIQTLPITSRYRWAGKIRRDSEIGLLIKTTADRAAAVRAHLESAHPYEVPEIIVIGAEASDAYLAWAVGETRPAS
jgi:periplasmic divalent cation tolerance protein